MSVKRIPRVLIVEDEAMIIMMLEDIFTEAGFEIAGVANTLEPALSLIDTCDCDVAHLDANLAGVSSAPAALKLTARGIPFLIVSGYSAAQQAVEYSGGLHVSKPFIPERLIDALWSLLPVEWRHSDGDPAK